MKNLIIALFLYSGVMAVKVPKREMITIDLEESQYENENYGDLELASVSEDIMMSLAKSLPEGEYLHLM